MRPLEQIVVRSCPHHTRRGLEATSLWEQAKRKQQPGRCTRAAVNVAHLLARSGRKCYGTGVPPAAGVTALDGIGTKRVASTITSSVTSLRSSPPIQPDSTRNRPPSW